MNLGYVAYAMVMGFLGAYAITLEVERKYKMSTKKSAIFFFGVYFILFIVCYILRDYYYLKKNS